MTTRTPLATAEQLELEELSLRVRDSAPVRAAVERLRDHFRADAIAATADGAATLDAAVESVTMAAVVEAVVLDPTDPRFFWVSCARRDWFGHTMPNTGYGIENPDNVYRHVAIDDTGTFVVRGRFATVPAMDLSFIVYGEIPGTGAMAKEGAPILAVLTSAQLDVVDGEFTITIDPDETGDRRNHIRNVPGSILLIARDSLSDWTTEMPCELTIERTTPATSPGPTFDETAELAARFVEQLGDYWGIRYNRENILVRPVNQVCQPSRRGIGMAVSGHFAIGLDEALVVTIEQKRARYIGFQLADPWGVALEYVDRSGSLSNAQARIDPEGTITYVLAATDPGAWNWLDTSGLSEGIFAIRWQPVPADEDIDGAIRSARIVPLARLRDELAPDAFLDPDGRRRQLDERRRSYERRSIVS